jgi:tetratricopeptide (TPR) repeat protein
MSYSGLVNQTIRYPHLQFYAADTQEIAQKFGPRATPRRVLDMDIATIKVCQDRAESPVDFAEFIAGNAAKRPLFHTAVHPNGELMAMMLRSFAMQIPDVDERLVANAETFLRENEGINSSTFHPVSKEILASLGFEWGEDYELYRTLLDQRATGDWLAILQDEKRYIEKFGNDTWCWLALTQAHTAIGTKSEASKCLIRLLDLSPGQLHAWLCGLTLYMKYDDHVGISGLMHRANAFFRGQRIFSQVMAYFHLNTGNAIAAEAYARDYHSRTPDRADALVPLLKILCALDRREEIKQIMNFVLANSPAQRLAELRANFNGSPELQAYLLEGG